MNIDITAFERETHLQLSQIDNTNQYREVSGKSYLLIFQKVRMYNSAHNTNIIVFNDVLKDSTVLMFH